MGEKYIPTEYRGKNSEKKEEDPNMTPAIANALKTSVKVLEEEECWDNFLFLVENQHNLGFDDESLEKDRTIITERLHEAKLAEEKAWTEALKEDNERLRFPMPKIPERISQMKINGSFLGMKERHSIAACFAGLGEFFGDGKSHSWDLAGQIWDNLEKDIDYDEFSITKHELHDPTTGVKIVFTLHAEVFDDDDTNTDFSVYIDLDTNAPDVYLDRVLQSMVDAGWNCFIDKK